MSTEVEEQFTMTLEEYNRLSPFQQGYVTYMRAEWPGAQIPKRNPYRAGTRPFTAWNSGAQAAVLEAQDGGD